VGPSTSERQPPPLNRFVVPHMTACSSATAVTASNTVDSELTSYFADCKTYAQNNGLDLWTVNETRLAQDMLSAPASQACIMGRYVLALWTADSW